MRSGELLGGLDIEDGDPTTCKKGIAIICNSHFCDSNYVWHEF